MPTAGPDSDARDARELTPTENADLCAGCVACCTYITVEVDAPRQAWEYDQWIWALHHDSINLYVERPEKWFLHVATRCGKLGHDGRCTIYGRHPVLCREYDPRDCERRLPHGGLRAWFKAGEELEAWLARERPRHYARLMAHRRDFIPEAAGGGAPAAGAANGSHVLVQVAGLGACDASTRRGQ